MATDIALHRLYQQRLSHNHLETPDEIVRWLGAVQAQEYAGGKWGLALRMLNPLDAALLTRSNDIIVKALQGGKYLTRAELGAALAQAGIVAEGVRLGDLIHYAELEAVVCSGPRRGKQFTYALLEERAPQARILERDEALAELTLRYYTGHGPATVHDFAW